MRLQRLGLEVSWVAEVTIDCAKSDRMKGIALEDALGHDPASEDCLVCENSTFPSENRAILLRVELIFAESGYGALASVRVRFEEHQIVLYGSFPSCFLLQLAHELVRSVVDHRILLHSCSDQHER